MSSFLFDLTVGALVLGFMVLLHEWGHFVAAKACGVRVDVFSIGFGPRIWGLKRGDTDYRISALPLGGYVRMAGDNPAEERSGEPHEFLSRPRWQRFIIAVAGPSANILLTFLLFLGVLVFVGMPVDRYMLQTPVVAAVPQEAHVGGVEAGDRIVQVNSTPTSNWQAVYSKIEDIDPGSMVHLEVARNGTTVNIDVPLGDGEFRANSVVGYPAVPPILDDLQPGYPAEKAGLKAGDRVVSIDGKPIVTGQQLPEIVRGSNGRPIHFVVEREGKEVPFTVTAKRTATPSGDMVWMIGLDASPTDETFEHQGLISSVREATIETIGLARVMGQILAGLFRGTISMRDLAGPVGIAQLSGQAAKRGPLTLINWMAYISLDLGLLNLLPIPIMDGGHVLMLTIEGTLRRDLSVAAKERFVQVGLVFILGLFAFVMYSDILRLFQR
jgi:regulator of sigma E protease